MDADKVTELLFRQTETLASWLTDRLPARQDNLLKTYLWSASLALTLSLVAFEQLQHHEIGRVFDAIAAAIALGVVIFCLDTLRGRPDQNTKFPDYFWYLERVNAGADPKEAIDGLTTHMKEVINHQITTRTSLAKKLRGISISLTTSFSFLFLSGIVAVLM